jgi:uncharacterized protein (DUF885 family)
MPQGASSTPIWRAHTTTDHDARQQIHEKGLSEVARIRAEMEKIMKQVGFTGTLQEFFTKLRTDPQFYYKTPEELLEAYRAMSKRIDPNLVKVMKTMPRCRMASRRSRTRSRLTQRLRTTASRLPMVHAPGNTTSISTSPRRGRSGR